MTQLLSDANPGVHPTDSYAYIDRIVVWLKLPWSNETVRLMRLHHCSRLWVADEPKLFAPEYVQRLEVNRPAKPLLKLLTQHPDALITQIEIALDLIFNNENEKNSFTTFLRAHHLKPYQRSEGVIVGEAEEKLGTYYTGPRRNRNVVVNYADKICRKTGEPDCLHIEWRMRGAATLGAAGINSLADLLHMDLREFWRTHLHLYTIDLNKLGRCYHNWQQGTRRKRPWIEFHPPIRYHVDLRMGHLIWRYWSTFAKDPITKIVQVYRKHFDIRSCLKKIDVEHLLPRSSGADT
jgi:hypothetical protein